MRCVLTGLTIGLGVFMLGGCANTETVAQEAAVVSEPTVTLSDVELYRSGSMLLAGQVTPDQLRRLRAEGVRAVINCRTQGEMDGLPFDEPGLIAELGMAYVHLPLGGDDGFSPDDVDRFALALHEHGEHVLVHCAGGGRVMVLYTAYLVRHGGLTVDQAKVRVQALGQGPSSLERLLGERVRYELTGEPLPSEDERSGA